MSDPGFWIFVGVVAGIFSIFALGLQIQFGYTGLLNFGHVAFMAIGAYTMAILVVRTDLSIWISGLIAILVSVAFGLLIGLPTLRLRDDYLAITTIAFGEMVRYFALNLHGLTGGPQGTINLLGPGRAASYNSEWIQFQRRIQGWLETLLGDTFLGPYINPNFTMMVIVWTVVLLLILFLQRTVHSPYGRVLRSIREDEDAAASLGKNVFSYKLQALAIGAAIGALAGLFYAWQFSFFSPIDFLPLQTFFAYVIVLLGGTARNWAVPVGAIIFAVLFAGTRFLDFWPLNELDSAERAFFRLIIVGLLLIALMAFRPQGIFGRKQEMVLE
jgi:ABC-type branched-subunit amino acid transport system permease subunit